MSGLHRLDSDSGEAISDLRECLPDAMNLEFRLIPELARIMKLAQGGQPQRHRWSRMGRTASA